MRGENIVYVGDLVRMTSSNLLRVPNFGRKSLREVEEELARLGLRLGMDLSTWTPHESQVNFFGTNPGHDSQEFSSKTNPGLLIRIEDLDLSVRTHNCLVRENIVYVGDLVQTIAQSLLRVPNFGRKSLREVDELLGAMGYHLGMAVSGWPPDDIEEASATVARSNREVLTDHDLANFSCPDARSFKDELLYVTKNILSKSRSQANCMIAYNSWDGGPQLTLEDIGRDAARYGFKGPVTRERIRQVILVGSRRLKKSARRVRFERWDEAVQRAEKLVPTSAEEIVSLFGYDDHCSARRSVFALKAVADIFGLDFSFDVLRMEENTMVFAGQSGSLEEEYSDLLSRMRGRSYSYFPAAQDHTTVEEHVLRSIIDGSSRLAFLDEDGQYFWKRPKLPPENFGRTGNQILSALCRIFSVASEVAVADLAQSLGRTRLVREKLPVSVIKGIAFRSGLFGVDDDWISRKPNLEWCGINNRDLSLLKVQAKHGRVVSSRVLYSALISSGQSNVLAGVTVARSPFLVHTISGRYQKEGLYKFIPTQDELDIPKLEAALSALPRQELDVDMHEDESEEYAEPKLEVTSSAFAPEVVGEDTFADESKEYINLISLPLDARTSLTGRYSQEVSIGHDGEWLILDETGNETGNIVINNGVVTGLKSIMQFMKLRKGDKLQLRVQDKVLRTMTIIV